MFKPSRACLNQVDHKFKPRLVVVVVVVVVVGLV